MRIRSKCVASLAMSATLVLVAASGSAAPKNYTLFGKFTSNRGKGAQVPVVGLTAGALAINKCGGGGKLFSPAAPLKFMSGPGTPGPITPALSMTVGANQRGGVNDLGCVPVKAGVKLTTSGKGVGGKFTLPASAFHNPHPMTTINAIQVTTITGALQFATDNSVTGPPAVRLEAPMGTMNTGMNTAAFRKFRANAWTTQTGRAKATFNWCPQGVGMTPNNGCAALGPGTFPAIVKYHAGPNKFGGTMSYLTKQVHPGSLINANGPAGLVVPFGMSTSNGMLATLATGRGYADKHVDVLSPIMIRASHMEMLLPRPIVGSQILVTMLGSAKGTLPKGTAQGWGFPLTTGTVLVRNTGTAGGGDRDVTFSAMGYDKTTAMGQRNISLVAGAIGFGNIPGIGKTPTSDLVIAWLPEPSGALQLVAGVTALLGIAAWRSRRTR